MALKKTTKAVTYPQGIPGAPGQRYAKSSTKIPRPTGMDPSNPNYGTLDSGGISDPVGRARSNFSWAASSDIPSGQDNLESKARRSFG